jgi:hypothetical protein
MQSFAVICRREDCLLSFVGDEEVRMVNDKELESGLKAMAEDFHLPGGGHKNLSQLVGGHMGCARWRHLSGGEWRHDKSADGDL